MKSNTSRILVILLLSLVLLFGSCSTGFIAGRVLPIDKLSSFLVLPGSNQGQPIDTNITGTPAEIEQLFAPFWQSWKLIHDQYVNQPVDDVALMRGAIQGMIDALGDEQSSYINPDELKAFDTQITGEKYEGIGAWVDITKDYLTVIAPMVNSPAEKAGLKTGDKIIAIDGEDMTGIDAELARQRVLGAAGTKVVLTILRPGVEKSFTVEIVRAAITSSNVIGKMLDKNVAYVQLIVFGDENTTRDLRDTLKRLLAQNPKGLVLDLRNNGGGLLDSAIDVSSEFIPEGVIAIEQFGDGRHKEYEAKPGGLATKIPLVVLINEGSASASEIVAGAVQYFHRGKLVGVKSYGKGSVQVWTNLVNKQGAIRITVAKWLIPNQQTINGVGLTPDIVVELSEENAIAGVDTQLDKAIEILTRGNFTP